MYIQLTAQTIITAGALVGAVSGLVALLVKMVRFVDRQKAQDEELQKIREAHGKRTTTLSRRSLPCSRMASWPA